MLKKIEECITLFFLIIVLGDCEESDLKVGNAINLFANFGDLSQSGRMISIYDIDDREVFWEKSVPIFSNAKEINNGFRRTAKVQMHLCDTLEDLLQSYYDEYHIEGTDKPWKAVMGDWTHYEILKAFGITIDEDRPLDEDMCCFALFKYKLIERNVTIDTNALQVNAFIEQEGDKVNFNDERDVRRFAEYYGSHYIHSYITGDSLYQVFMYKGPLQSRAYRNLKIAMKVPSIRRNMKQKDIEYFFSSTFLKQIGKIMASSGNATIETWAQQNLRDKRYRYTKSTLLQLSKSLTKIETLKKLMKAGSGALLGIDFKISTPVFLGELKQGRFRSIMDNDLKLWEVND